MGEGNLISCSRGWQIIGLQLYVDMYNSRLQGRGYCSFGCGEARSPQLQPDFCLAAVTGKPLEQTLDMEILEALDLVY